MGVVQRNLASKVGGEAETPVTVVHPLGGLSAISFLALFLFVMDSVQTRQ